MFLNRFQELKESIAKCHYSEGVNRIDELKALALAFRFLESVLAQKGTVYVVGNGGSAGIASHFSTDLIKSMKIPSQTLYDSNLLTCLGNDYGYEEVFSYPLEKLLKKEDLLVAISSSGKSQNILNAAKVAIEKGSSLITLSGFEESNPLKSLGQLNFWIPKKDYGLVETAHFFLLHTIVDCWSKRGSKEPEYAAVCG